MNNACAENQFACEQDSKRGADLEEMASRVCRKESTKLSTGNRDSSENSTSNYCKGERDPEMASKALSKLGLMDDKTNRGEHCRETERHAFARALWKKVCFDAQQRRRATKDTFHGKEVVIFMA